MATELLTSIKSVLGKMGMYNLIHYRVIKDFLDESHFGNCELIMRIKKIDIRILRDRGDVYFEIKHPNTNKFYFVKLLYEAMEMQCPQNLSNVVTTESDVACALKILLSDLGVIKLFIYKSDSIKELEKIVKQKKKEFIGELSG